MDASLQKLLIWNQNCDDAEDADIDDDTNDDYVSDILYGDTINHPADLPRSIPRNSVESDHGCTSRIYFVSAGDNVTLTLYNVTLASQKPCLWLQQNKRQRHVI